MCIVRKISNLSSIQYDPLTLKVLGLGRFQTRWHLTYLGATSSNFAKIDMISIRPSLHAPHIDIPHEDFNQPINFHIQQLSDVLGLIIFPTTVFVKISYPLRNSLREDLFEPSKEFYGY